MAEESCRHICRRAQKNPALPKKTCGEGFLEALGLVARAVIRITFSGPKAEPLWVAPDIAHNSGRSRERRPLMSRQPGASP